MNSTELFTVLTMTHSSRIECSVTERLVLVKLEEQQDSALYGEILNMHIRYAAKKLVVNHMPFSHKAAITDFDQRNLKISYIFFLNTHLFPVLLSSIVFNYATVTVSI